MADRAGSRQIFKPRRTGLGDTIHGHVHQAPVVQMMNSAMVKSLSTQ